MQKFSGITFFFDENTKILDLGSETGSNIKFVLEGTKAQASNIYIAPILIHS